MTYEERQNRLNAIIDEMNALYREQEDGVEGVGATDLDIALDWMRDSFDGDYDDYVEPTIEEKEVIKAECARNLEKYTELEDKINALIDEYYDLTGCGPHYSSVTNTVSRSWNETIPEGIID